MSRNTAQPFLTAEYALGLLNLQETAQAHALLGADYDAVASALAWENRFLALVDELPAETPSPELLLQIQTALGHDTTVPLRPSAMPPMPAASTPPEATAKPEAPQTPARQPAKSGPPAGRTRTAQASERRPGQPKPRRSFWSSLWLWRGATLVLALGLIAAALQPKAQNASAGQSAPSDAASAAVKPSAAPAPTAASAPPTRAAILQAPGQTSTPGWIVTFDASGDLMLTPRVKIEIAQDAAVYLWVHGDTETPRLLAELSPNSPLVLPAQAAGNIPTGQIFEITLEPRGASTPQEPKGPILFIGRLVALS